MGKNIITSPFLSGYPFVSKTVFSSRFDEVASGDDTYRLVIRGERTIKSASLRKVIMSDDRAMYTIESRTPIPFKLNDTVNIYGQTYRLNNPPTVEKVAENLYRYTVEFEGVMYDLMRCQFFNADGTGFKTTADFSIIGNVELFLTVIANNMKRFSPNWVVGTFQNKETKTIAFSGENCLQALQKICAEFKLEFRIDEVNGQQVINVGNFGQELPLTFEYGKGKGLYSLTRTNVSDHNIVNRLYVSGGEENLPEGYRNFSDKLKLPAPLEYLEDTANIALNGLREGFLELPDIYPHRTGKVTALGDTKYKFADTTTDFDLKAKDAQGNTIYLKNGESAKVHFNTGNLAGYEFEVKNYDHATKTFEIIPFKNEQGQQFPDPSTAAFQFSVNDEYVIINIYAPDSYLDNAEEDLLTKATAEFEKFKSAQVNYRIDVDPAYLKKYFPDASALPFNLHDSVKVKDVKLAVDRFIKIIGFTRDILEPWKYEIDVADSYEIAYASQVAMQVATINNTVAAQNQQIKLNYRNGYERLQQLNDLVFDTDGYFDTQRIKPLSIETQMLSVGSRSQMLTLEGVVIDPNHTSDPNKVFLSSGKLVHFTVDTQVREWRFTQNVLSVTDAAKSYYIYAKCPRMGVNGLWLVTTDKLKFDFDPSAYHFLIGVLHPVNAQNFRYYTPLEGATMINGRYITTGKVQSVDGSTWFDLDLAAVMLANYGGITGKQAAGLGLSTAGLWFGTDYAGKENAPFKVSLDGNVQIKSTTTSGEQQGLYLENGEIIWRDQYNVIRRRIGIANGTPYDRTFSGNGTLLYEVNASGFQSYAVGEQWMEASFNKLSETDENATDDTLRNVLKDETIQTTFLPWKPGIDKMQFSISINYTAWQYFAGNTNSGNLQYEGYHESNNSPTSPFIANGWYSFTTGNIGWRSSSSGEENYTVLLFYIKNGKIEKQKSVTVNL